MSSVSLGSVLVDIILMIVTAATQSWVHANTTYWGLFTTCAGGFCAPTISVLAMMRDPGAAVSQARACQGFLVLAIIADFAIIPLVICRLVSHADSPTIKALTDKIPRSVDIALAAVVAGCLTIVWTVGLALRFHICAAGSPDDSCEVHYGFALVFLTWASSIYVLQHTWSEANAAAQQSANAVQAIGAPLPNADGGAGAYANQMPAPMPPPNHVVAVMAPIPAPGVAVGGQAPVDGALFLR